MLQKLQKRSNKDSSGGFTIIEVLIVLAIAGLILLIVFLAVPTLQRNARNTQRKTDAAAVAAAVANFISNNGGTLPIAGGVKTDATDTSSVDICSTVACAAPTSFQAAKLGYYLPTKVFIVANDAAGAFSAVPTTQAATATNINTESVTIDTGYGCNPTGTGVSTAAITRSAAILYVLEQNSGGTGNLQCVEQ